jgi:hypothetical protein
MNVRRLYIASGYVSLFLGILAAISIHRAQFLYYGIGLSIIGMLSAITNIFLNAKYFSDEEKYPKGYIGMFLSSLPVIFLMLVIFKFRK